MKKYEVIAKNATLRTGKVALTDEQANAREYGLAKTKTKGVYTIEKPIHFKRGEVFEHDGEVSKTLLHAVQDTDAKQTSGGKKTGGKGSGKKDSSTGGKKSGKKASDTDNNADEAHTEDESTNGDGEDSGNAALAPEGSDEGKAKSAPTAVSNKGK